MNDSVLQLGPRITCLPVIHGSGDFALAVRRVMLTQQFKCLAVPLPPSFQRPVEAAITRLPAPALVAQVEPPLGPQGWSPDRDPMFRDAEGGEPEFNLSGRDEEDDDDDDFDPDDEQDPRINYVPIDPCQPVIMALRVALGEHMPRRFIDLEVESYEAYGQVMPDPYALKQVSLERFAAAVLPAIERPDSQQRRQRIAHMASELRELAIEHESILLVCSVLDWPWIREAYFAADGEPGRPAPMPEHAEVDPPETYRVKSNSLMFMLGELPFITGLYERARAELEDDENLSIDGVKELLIAARANYRAELKGRARKITPHTLRVALKYIRNLSLLESRFTPDLYSVVIAAKQVCGDRYALHVAETAREYPYAGGGEELPELGEEIKLGIDQAQLPDGAIVETVNRLAGPPCEWRSCELQRRPEKQETERWKMRWNPFRQCSWPPEDELIENFRQHVFDRAKQIMGADLAKTEKFTTSIKDGIDIRDTLRNWHTGDIYVRELPPARAALDAVVMLFDYPADPRRYTWRSTWYAEHENESTLAFFATDFQREPVGPGICLATYGGAFFLFPPRPIPEIWNDPRLDFAETLEERLLAAACLHSECRQIALLAPAAPGAGWRRLAKRFNKRWVHVPLGQFSDSTVQQLRMVHVLNGHQVRSYAAEFIRKA